MNPTDTMGFLSELDKTQDVYRNNVGGLERQLKKRKGVPEPTVKAIAAQRLRKELEDKERKVNAELQQDPNSIAAQTEAFLAEATQRDIAKGVSDVMDMRNMRRQKGAQKAAQRFAKAPVGTGIMSALTGSPQKKKEEPRDPRQLQRQQGAMVGAAGGLARFQEGGITQADIEAYRNSGGGIGRIKRSRLSDEEIREILLAQRQPKQVDRRGRPVDRIVKDKPEQPQEMVSGKALDRPDAGTMVDSITGAMASPTGDTGGKDDIVEQFLDTPKKEAPKPADAGLGLMTPDQEQAYIDQNIGPEKLDSTGNRIGGGRLEALRREQIGEAGKVKATNPKTGDVTTTGGTGLRAFQDKILDSQTNLETGQKQRRTKFDAQTKEREGRLLTDDDALYGEDARKKAVSAGFYKGLSPFGPLSQTLVGEYQAGRRFDIAEEAAERGIEDREIKSEDMNVKRLTQNVTNAKDNLATEKGFTDYLATARKDDIQIVQNVLNNMATNARTKALVKQADATIEMAREQAKVDKVKAQALVAEKIADINQEGKKLLETNTTYNDLQEEATKLLEDGDGNPDNLDAKDRAKYEAIVQNIALMEQGYTSDLTQSLQGLLEELDAMKDMKRGGLAALM